MMEMTEEVYIMNHNSTFDFTFLGTCARDFSEKLQTEHRDHFDDNARRASAVLLNSSCLIDAGIHILDSLRIIRKPLREIEDVFVTHFHDDHFSFDNIEKIAKEKEVPLRVWVRENAKIVPIPNVSFIRMTPFETYEVKNGLFITGLPANHDSSVFPQHFLIEKNQTRIFYGCDGAWFLNETYRFLRDKALALVVLDCTVGDYVGDYRLAEHNSIPMIRLMLPSLKTIGAINEQTSIYLSHIAPSLHRSHAETQAITKDFRANVAFDGLTIFV